MQHRGNANSDDDDNGLLKSSFIESGTPGTGKNRNRIAGTLSDDLAMFEIVDSPQPKHQEETKDPLRTKEDRR